MITKKMYKIITFILSFNIFLTLNLYSNEKDFKIWFKNFKVKAVETGISSTVVDDVLLNAKFLPKVIEYDRYQPEFYEDTFTYIKKRTSNKKIKDGIRLYKKEKFVIDKVENEFQIE